MRVWGGGTAPQHLVCRVVQSLHINHMQMGIIEVFICRRLHMNTSMIPVCIWLICRLCTALHTKCCGAVWGLGRKHDGNGMLCGFGEVGMGEIMGCDVGGCGRWCKLWRV